MFSFAYEYLLALPDSVALQCVKEFNTAAIQIFEGQQLDMDFENRQDVQISEYLEMIAYKTSVLLAASLKIGAIVGGASEHDQQAVYDFGLNLGLAFQIKDDYLDAYGDPASFGKKVGGDIVQNKKTYLYLSAWNKADDNQKSQLIALQNEKDESKKVEDTMRLFELLNSGNDSLEAANNFYEKSLASLGSMTVETERKSVLYQLAKSIQERAF